MNNKIWAGLFIAALVLAGCTTIPPITPNSNFEIKYQTSGGFTTAQDAATVTLFLKDQKATYTKVFNQSGRTIRNERTLSNAEWKQWQDRIYHSGILDLDQNELDCQDRPCMADAHFIYLNIKTDEKQIELNTDQPQKNPAWSAMVTPLAELANELAQNTNNFVTVSTTKNQYSNGETVSFQIQNNTSQTVYLAFSCPISFTLQKQGANGFESIEPFNPQMIPLISCAAVPLNEATLEPGKSTTIDWQNPQVFDAQGNPLELAGTYKATFQFSTTNNGTFASAPFNNATTNEFEITNNPQNESVWLTYAPTQCQTNPWEIWHADLNRVYIRAPTEKEILTEYYRTVHNIEILEFQQKPADPDQVVCRACNCPRGDTVAVSVNDNDSPKMVELEWTLINEPIACTMDARICPDGSAVGRTAPFCQFEACPTVTPNTNCQVWSPGACEMIISSGYHYNSSTNQCEYFSGGSGCANPPFTTKANCEQTCKTTSP